jgi:hypothetical protein
MSKIALSPNASGTGTFSIASPGTNTDRTLTLPDASGTLARTADIPSVNPFTLGTAVASTSGTAIDFTGIPSWAKRVTVMFDGVSTNGTSSMVFRLGTSAGVLASGYAGITGYAASNGTSGAASNTTGVNLATSFNTATNLAHGQIVAQLVFGNVWAITGIIGYTSGSFQTCFTQGYTSSLSGTLDRLRITTVNGTDTFDAGTINVSWEG